MKKKEQTPFYLQGEPPNIITKPLLKKFEQQNPELKAALHKHPPYLYLLKNPAFESLTYWIISQQISGTAANMIIQRLNENMTEITPKKILEEKTLTLRRVGLSRTKIETVRRLASYFQHNTHDFQAMTDQEIMNSLTSLKGIGEWTVQMFLIFNLGRKNVLPLKDLGVRKGLKVLYHLEETPSVKLAKDLTRKWKPYATIGTLLAWRVIGE